MGLFDWLKPKTPGVVVGANIEDFEQFLMANNCKITEQVGFLASGSQFISIVKNEGEFRNLVSDYSKFYARVFIDKQNTAVKQYTYYMINNNKGWCITLVKE